jgi:DNA-binding PadR family transcriptional regulator
MRPPRYPQNPLLTPLNAILRTEGNVRILRVLALTPAPVSAAELANRARIGRTSIYPLLDNLEKTGIIEFKGVGSQRQVEFRIQHPLGRALINLFREEHRRVDALMSALRGKFKRLSLTPVSAWVEGISDEASADSDLKLWVVADPKSVSSITRRLGDEIGHVEKTFGVHFDIRGMTRSELESSTATDKNRLGQAAVITGVPPVALLPTSKNRSSQAMTGDHSEHDMRSRRLGVAIAAKLKWDPSLIRAAKIHLNERMKTSSERERHELQEWSRILSALPAAQLRRLLEEDSERSTRLRQTLPALGLLTPREREAVLASKSDAEARAVVLGK